MEHSYTLYDALISINVPHDKARAVVDAMERDMYDKLATKADLRHVQELLSKDMQHLSTTLTVRLGSLLMLGIGAAIYADQTRLTDQLTTRGSSALPS
jgi:hypothetical protein